MPAAFLIKMLSNLIVMLGITICPMLTVASAGDSPESFLLPEIRADHPAITNIDVLIDVGHGGIDGGAVHGSLLEKDINLAVAKKTYDALRQQGFHVLLNRIGDYALSSENKWLSSTSRHRKDLAQRSELANEVRPKMMISLHVNSSPRSSRRGPVVIHQKNEQSKQLARELQNALNPLFGTNGSPVRGKKYYILKHTQVPTVIIEMGFITNEQDRMLLQSEDMQWRIGEKIAEGVEQYVKQSKKTTD